ncbi:MAG TPA: CNNM domain-containing protein [Phycisphaerae bacterium]|nr:CNNM domain-containing protein [Phycisphaerae bacterium]
MIAALPHEPPPAWMLPVWYAVALVSLIAAGIFAGNEIGIYSLSKVRLRLRTAKNEPNALMLADWLQRPTYALEGLLVLQNICTFAFEAAVTEILSHYGFDELKRGLISILIVTPLVLVFADIMPKDLFHSYADRWTYRLVPFLKFLFRLITWIPLLPLVNWLSHLTMKMVRSKTADDLPKGPRTEMLSLFQESAATGVLTGTQQDLVQRALRLARINIREIMIPWNSVVGVPASISTEGLRALVRRYNVSRMPVLGRSLNEVLGIVDVLDVLTALASPGAAASFRLIDHVRPPMTLIGEQTVRSAITLMQRASQTLAVVVDRQGRAIGLVTMKDLVEELVGDLDNW